MSTNQNRVAVVTGAGQGIGEGIADQLAKDGYSIVVADLNDKTAKAAADKINNAGGHAVAVQGDVAKKESHEEFVQAAVDNFGRLDTYVNNAGIVLVRPIMDLTEDELENIYHINVFGDVWGMQAAVSQFKKQDDGDHIRKIINASSIAGHFADAILAAYSTTKFAVRGLTQVGAKEFAKDHITVNAYCPGIVDTPMWSSVDKSMIQYLGGQSGDYTKQVTSGITLGRMETTQDVANFVSFLASPKSDYMNGQSVQIDGGMKMI